MNDFPVHTAETADASGRALLERARETFGMVPNLFGVMAASPAVGQAYLDLGQRLTETGLTPLERQVVLLTASRVNGCGYCMAAHSTVAGMDQIPRHVVSAIRDDHAIDEPQLEALRRFTATLVHDRGWVDAATREAFLAAGYRPAQMLEVILAVTMKTLSNYVDHLAGTPLDEVFQARAWNDPQARRQTG